MTIIFKGSVPDQTSNSYFSLDTLRDLVYGHEFDAMSI